MMWQNCKVKSTPHRASLISSTFTYSSFTFLPFIPPFTSLYVIDIISLLMVDNMRHSNFKARKEVLRITELEVMLMAAYLNAYAVKKQSNLSLCNFSIICIHRSIIYNSKNTGILCLRD